MNKGKIVLTFLTSLFIFSINLYSQSYNIEYFGIVSTEIDSNMSKMTSDLYFTQLKEIQNFNISDSRFQNCLSALPPKEILSETNLSFFTEIKKQEDSESWNVILHVVDRANNHEETQLKVYDSFYKILMEPKSTLQASLKQLIEGRSIEKEITKVPAATKTNESIISTENLSGTWSGENFIDKIVILRGGRGFVIFNNGASMNISIELLSSKGAQEVLIIQKGRSNASFFPELPRNLALNAALEANPIQWKLSVIDNDTLKGLKTTLVSNADTYSYEDVQVTWKRIN